MFSAEYHKQLQHYCNQAILTVCVIMLTILSSLYKKGFIIDDCVNEMDLIKEEYNNAKYGQEQFYLMVFPTQDCNLKCWYCYESHKPNTRMSQTVIGDILKHVERKLKESSIRRFRLGFFGENL